MKKLLLIPTLLATTTPVMVLSSCGTKHININEKLYEDRYTSKYFDIKKNHTYTFHVDLTKFICGPGDWSFGLYMIDPVSGDDIRFTKFEVIKITMGKYTLTEYTDQPSRNHTYKQFDGFVNCWCYEEVDTANVTIKSNKSTKNVIAMWGDT